MDRIKSGLGIRFAGNKRGRKMIGPLIKGPAYHRKSGRIPLPDRQASVRASGRASVRPSSGRDENAATAPVAEAIEEPIFLAWCRLDRRSGPVQ